MHTYRANISAPSTRYAFVMAKHYLELTAQPFRVCTPITAKVTSLEKNQSADTITVIDGIFLDIKYPPF
jgi:hypothetical protein